jgi:6-phosphogluconolactonase (cycloisomerase 2 family)
MSDDGNYLAICQRGISQGSFIVYQVDKQSN